MTESDRLEGATRRVCAWCSDVVGETYVAIEEHGAAGYEGHHFCDYDCLTRWVDAD